jgi:hypothetical protein
MILYSAVRPVRPRARNTGENNTDRAHQSMPVIAGGHNRNNRWQREKVSVTRFI